jgi:mannose-6-phosphate isomerase-like protein (cupin superfamily)
MLEKFPNQEFFWLRAKKVCRRSAPGEIAMEKFVARVIAPAADATAPDGSEVRLLAATERGSRAHFRLPAGAVSRAVAHRTVDEVWYFLSGSGRMWRRNAGSVAAVPVAAGVSIAIPAGTAFQCRAAGDSPLEAVAVTMPPWPGMDEAIPVEGVWPATA